MAKRSVSLRTKSVCWLALTVLSLSGCALVDNGKATSQAPPGAVGSSVKATESPVKATESPVKATESPAATGAMKLAYPSAQFPAQAGTNVSLTLQLPADWKAMPAPETVLGAARVAEVDGFSPNVIVRVTRRPAQFEATEAISELKAFMATKTQGTTSKPHEVQIDSRPFVGADVSWVEDKIGKVVQAHLFTVIFMDESPQLVHITGSVSGAHAREDAASLQAVMKSLMVRRAGSTF